MPQKWDARQHDARKQLQVANRALHAQYRMGADAPETLRHLYEMRYSAERALSQWSGRVRMHLECGHVATVERGLNRDYLALLRGVVICQARTETLGWGSHKGREVRILGWVAPK